ncbi:hypothetical protein PG984_012784 [Apiospora sp. TS-2023a]
MEEMGNVVDDTGVSVVVVARKLDDLLLLLLPEAAAEGEDTCCGILLLMKGSTFREELVIEGIIASGELAPGVLEIIIVWVSVGMTVTVLSRPIPPVALPTLLPICVEMPAPLSAAEFEVTLTAPGDCVARLGTILDDVLMILVGFRLPPTSTDDPEWLVSDTVEVEIPGPRKPFVTSVLLPDTVWVLVKTSEDLAVEIGVLLVVVIAVETRVPPILSEDSLRLEPEAMEVGVIRLATVVASPNPVSAPLGTIVIVDVLRVLEPEPSIVDDGIIDFPKDTLCVAGAVAASGPAAWWRTAVERLPRFAPVVIGMTLTG